MISKILREVSAFDGIDDTTGERVLAWVQRVDIEVQKEAINNIKEAKEFDTVRYNQ